MSTAQEIIAKQTGAVTTPVFVRVRKEMIPATIMADGLAGVEKAVVLRSVDGGETNEPAQQDGAAVELTATNNTITVNSPMMLGFTKEASVGAAGVFLSYEREV